MILYYTLTLSGFVDVFLYIFHQILIRLLNEYGNFLVKIFRVDLGLHIIDALIRLIDSVVLSQVFGSECELRSLKHFQYLCEVF